MGFKIVRQGKHIVMSDGSHSSSVVKTDSVPGRLGRDFDVLGCNYPQLLRHASDLIIPQSRRLFFAGVRETYNSNRLLASPDTAQTPTVPAASARF